MRRVRRDHAVHLPLGQPRAQAEAQEGEVDRHSSRHSAWRLRGNDAHQSANGGVAAVIQLVAFLLHAPPHDRADTARREEENVERLAVLRALLARVGIRHRDVRRERAHRPHFASQHSSFTGNQTNEYLIAWALSLFYVWVIIEPIEVCLLIFAPRLMEWGPIRSIRNFVKEIVA